MQKHARFLALCALGTGFCLATAAGAKASEADVAAFYKDKQVTLYISNAVGGGYDLYARLIGRYIGAYIPGHPVIVPVNMPGAGGAVVINHLLTGVARDGSSIASLIPGAITAPLFTEQKRYDSRSLDYLGNANSEDDGCWVRSDASVKSYPEVFSKELIMGATAPGDNSFDFPTLQNNILGTHFKVISGYGGSNEVMLAIEKNEVQGICGVGVPAMTAQKPTWVANGFIKMLVQENAEGSEKLNQAGVPRAPDFAKTDEDRKALDLIYIQQKFGRPYGMPPGTPPERREALRSAFLKALQDEKLIAEAQKLNLEINPISGGDLQKIVDGLYATPPATVNRAKQALGRGDSK